MITKSSSASSIPNSSEWDELELDGVIAEWLRRFDREEEEAESELDEELHWGNRNGRCCSRTATTTAATWNTATTTAGSALYLNFSLHSVVDYLCLSSNIVSIEYRQSIEDPCLSREKLRDVLHWHGNKKTQLRATR